MAMMRHYVCPSCEKEFSFLHHPSDEPPPRFCPLCGYDTADGGEVPLFRFKRAIVAPHVANPVGKNTDNYFKAMEEGEQFRVDKARELGLSAEDAKLLKVDWTDNIKEGEISAKPVVNDVTRNMEQLRRMGVPIGYGAGGSVGLGYSTTVGEGPYPNIGAQMRNVVRANYKEQLDPNHASQRGAMSDIPALETEMPGYRKRA